jgi:hypothetical protein
MIGKSLESIKGRGHDLCNPICAWQAPACSQIERHVLLDQRSASDLGKTMNVRTKVNARR